MADRDRRRERTTPETSPKETPPEEAPPKEDLSATIQDPDAPPGVPPHPDPGAQLPRRSLPRTEEGIFDFSGIGRRARPDDGQPAPVPAPRGAPLPLRAPSPPADDKFDMAPFRRADGSYDMRALLVVRRNWEMMRREEEERRKILGSMWRGRGERRERPPSVRGRGRMKGEQATPLSNLSEKSLEVEKSGKGSGEGEKGEKGEREGEGVKGEEGKREAGGDDDEDDLYGASPVKPIPPKSPPTQKGTEEEKKQQPDDEDDLYGASPMKPISPKLPPVDEDDLYGASPMKPISPKLPPVEEDDLYGASPMKPISPKLPPDEKEDTGNKKQGQEQRPEDKKSDIPLENPKSPKVSPEKKEDSLWDRIFGRAQKPSPTKSEKYRRLAAKNAKVPTNKEKFDYWMKHDLSSPRAFVADEQQWQNEMELLYAREKYIAELQQTKADARAMISEGGRDSSETQKLREVIHQCELQLQEAEGLEDKRQRSRSIQASLDLETSPTLKAKFNDQLRDLNSQIEVGEEKEKSILKPWANLSPDWSARLQKAADMTPSERARLIAERGLQAPARAPGQLKQSSAEKALRAKWAAEDSPLEDEVMEIDMISDESEQDLEWNLAMRRRQSVLLARHRELSKLWTKEAEQIRADREAAWLESKGEKRIPGSAPRPRVPSTGQSENLREGGGGSGGRGAGSSETRSEKQKQEKKDKEDEGKESARTEVEGSKKVSGTGAEDADELGRRRRRQTQGLLSVAGLRQMPELKPTAPLSRKKSTDAVSNSPGTPLPSQRKESTPEQPLSPFRATRPISPLQEGRKRVKFHVDSEVSEYLESLAKKRVQREMGQLGEEMVDLDKVRNLVDKVAKPAPLGSAEAAESVAAMRRRATRIREAKERLALAAQKEVDRLREEEEKKKKKEEKEKARGEGKSLFEEEEDKKNRKGEEEKPSFQEIMEQLERDRVARQNKERIRQKMELERRKKEEEEMAAEREKRRKEAERERREMESKDMEDWTSERLERLKLERERREKSGKQESSMDKDKRELKEKKEEDEEDAKKRDIERMQKKRQEEDDRDRREERDRRERDDRERREKYGKEEKELKEREEKEKIEKEKIEKEKIEKEKIEKEKIEKEKKKRNEEEENRKQEEKRKEYLRKEREISLRKEELERKERENEERIEREERERKAKAKKEVEERTERAKRKLKEDYEREMKKLEDSKRDDQARRDRKEQYEREVKARVEREREENERRKIKEAKDKARREREQEEKRESIRKAKRKMEEELEKNRREKEIHDQKEKELKQQRELMDREREAKLKRESDEKRQLEERARREKEARLREELEEKDRENAERQRIIDDESDFEDEEDYGALEQLFFEYLFRVSSWIKRRDPENTETGSTVHSESSQHKVPDSSDNDLDSEHPSLVTPPSRIMDPNSPPDSPPWLRDPGPDLPSLDHIHLHLTVFSSPDQRHPNPSTPIYYATYSDVPLWWNVSQLKRFLGGRRVRSEELHGRIETFPGCVGWVKEDGKAIKEGDAEEKEMRLRVAGRWLKHGGKTLRDEGLRDYENLVVVLVGQDDDLERRGWRNCLVDADGFTGFKEGWPGKGEIRTPADRVAWLGEEMDGVFGVFRGGVGAGG